MIKSIDVFVNVGAQRRALMDITYFSAWKSCTADLFHSLYATRVPLFLDKVHPYGKCICVQTE